MTAVDILGDALHVLFGDGHDFLQARVRIIRIVPGDDAFGNIDGQTERALAGADRAAPGCLFRFFQLPIGDRLLLKPGDFFVDGGFDIFIFLFGATVALIRKLRGRASRWQSC